MAKSRSAAPVVEDVEVEDDEDVELDELDEDVEEDEAPAKSKSNGKGKATTPAVTFGVKDLADHLAKELGKPYTTRELRTQIRRMARDGSNRVDREITAGNRTRYDWVNGLKDPEVKAIIAAVKGGEVEAGKKEALDKLKTDKAAKKAKATKAEKKASKAAAAAEVDEDDE